MKIGLVTDSTADIPAVLVRKHKIEVVPALLVIDGKSLVDGEGITREEFYTQMPSFNVPATTAAPSAGSFMERYEKLFDAGVEKILSIHASSKLSGIFNAARLAAESFANRVQVIDSEQLSLGCGFQVLAAAEAIARDAAFEEIKGLIENIQGRIRLIAVLDTLEYLRRSGRVSWAKARIGSFLNLKPLIELTHGRVENLGAVRTTRLANIRILEMAQEMGAIERLAVLHTNAEDRAQKFLKEFNPLLPEKHLLLNVTTAIGAHLGPNGVGFAVVRK